MNEDAALLREYAELRSEAAFAALVERHVSLVYFAALRRTGDAHLAEDIAQRVFTVAAQQAGALARHASLAGWLYTTTRFIAAKAMREERRRKNREQEAQLMHELSAPETAANDWEKLRPVLDAALDELGGRDREAVLLRCLEGRAFAEIGAALRLSEDAARMRVDRALDKLRARLERRGVTSTAAALGAALAAQSAAAAPAGLAAAVTGGALASATSVGAAGAALKIFHFMSTTKISLGIAGAVAVAATMITLQQRRTNEALRGELLASRQQVAALTQLRAENQKLAAERTSIEDGARAEHEELLQLRAAREAFRQRQAAAAARGGASASGATVAPGGGAAPGMTSIELMQDVGSATPSATAQSIAWGLQHAEFKRVAELLAFAPADREKLAAFIASLPDDTRAKYGTPEQIVALAMAGSPRPIAAVQLLKRDQPDPNTEVQTVQWQYQDGAVQQNELKFSRDGDGWKQVVSSATVDRVIAFLKSKP
ncbi:MAG TPA: sigma-70 family RNA polymerase sigma factor [Opitutaceae bacterium]|nr:sigma-70 family RNA polymerase sigma factor [Opitutaceae bacterium]